MTHASPTTAGTGPSHPAIDPWWKQAVVYQIYPRSFADSNGDGIGDLAGSPQPRLPRRPGRRRASGSRRSTPRRRTTTATTSATTSDIDPMFGTLDRLRRADRRGARARHEAGDGPGGQPHLRRAPVVHRVPLGATATRSATGTGGGRPATAWPPGDPGAEPTNWDSFFSGPAWQLDEATGEYYLHLFSPQAARPELGEPRGPPGRLRDDELVARPRRRRLPDGRHQHDLQGAAAGRRAVDARLAVRRRRRRSTSTARGSTSSCARCTRRCSPAAPKLLTVGETPGVTVEQAGCLHRPGHRARST